MKKISLCLITLVCLLSLGCSKPKKAYLDDIKISTVSINKGNIKYAVRYFTNYELKKEDLKVNYGFHGNGIEVNEVGIEYFDMIKDVYVYNINFSLRPIEDKADYSFDLEIDNKKYQVENCINYDYKLQTNKIIKGYDVTRIHKDFKEEVEISVDFNKVDLNTVTVNNVLNTVIRSKTEPSSILTYSKYNKGQIIGYTYNINQVTYGVGNVSIYKDYDYQEIIKLLK